MQRVIYSTSNASLLADAAGVLFGTLCEPGQVVAAGTVIPLGAC